MKPDPGGIFPSDEHRQVLGHLSHPDDDYGYSGDALVFRIGWPVDLDEILKDLESSGHAASYDGAWRMTQEGFDALTGPIAHEPPEPGPAQIESHPASAGAATKIEVETK